MVGFVVCWNDLRDFGLIEDYNGRRYAAISNEITPDEIGRRYLLQDEEVCFTTARSVSGNYDRAAAVRPTREPVVVPDGYEEECTVIKYERLRGYLRRPFGGCLFFTRKFVTSGESFLRPGIKVLVQLSPSVGTQRYWNATNVRVISQVQPDTPELVPDTAMASAFEQMTSAQ